MRLASLSDVGDEGSMKTLLLLTLNWPRAPARPASWACDPCSQLHRIPYLQAVPRRVSLVDFLLCCHCLEVLNTFWKRGPAFSFCSGCWKLYSQSWLSGPHLASVTRSSIDNQGSSNYLSHNSFLCSLFAQNSLKYRLLKRSFRTHSTRENSLHALKQHICF